MVRRKSDPSLREVSKPDGKSEAPAWPSEQADYDVAYGALGDGQIKLVSWNVNGINAWCNKDGVASVKREAPDVLCLQETKANEDDIEKWVKKFDGQFEVCMAAQFVFFKKIYLLNSYK